MSHNIINSTQSLTVSIIDRFSPEFKDKRYFLSWEFNPPNRPSFHRGTAYRLLEARQSQLCNSFYLKSLRRLRTEKSAIPSSARRARSARRALAKYRSTIFTITRYLLFTYACLHSPPRFQKDRLTPFPGWRIVTLPLPSATEALPPPSRRALTARRDCSTDRGSLSSLTLAWKSGV